MKVAVLLSTYNGAKYLPEQLDSLLSQQGVSLSLIVRDDGSVKDNTLDILHSYRDKFEDITILQEPNVGAEESFNALCNYAKINSDADYYAFCDQDDVWEPDKLQVAVHKLNGYSSETPNLYFSNLKLVDKDLNYMRDLYSENQVSTEKRLALLQIFTFGCTCVFNKKALDCYCSVENNKVFHDNWIYAICSFLGHVYYDKIGHILYRQHGSNLSGNNSTSGFKHFVNRIHTFLNDSNSHLFQDMAKQLLNSFTFSNTEDQEYIKKVAYYNRSFYTKLKLLCDRRYRTGGVLKDISIFLRILYGNL